jgi:heme-degrading monooxygenase HmoA
MSFARLTRFPIKRDKKNEAQETSRQFEQQLHDLPGHESTLFFFDPDGVLTVVTVWDSQEHADGATAIRQQAADKLGDAMDGEPKTVIGEAFVNDRRVAQRA